MLTCIALVSMLPGGSAQYWAKDFGGIGGDRIADVKVDAQDNAYVIGEFSVSMEFDGQTLVSVGGTDVFVAKVDAMGALLWMKRAGGTAIDRGLKLAVDVNGTLAVIGQFMGDADLFGTTIASAGGTMDWFVAKLDAATGDALWVRSGGSALYSDRPYGVSVSPNGNITVVGEFRGTAAFGPQVLTSVPTPTTGQPSQDVFVASYSPTGTLLWVQQGAAEYSDRAIDVVSDAQSNLYVCGQFSDTVAFDVVHNNAMYNATFLIKFDATGNEQWFRRCGGAAFNHVRDMLLTSTNELLLCGDLQGNMVYVGAAPMVIGDAAQFAYYLLRVGLDGELIDHTTMPSQNRVSVRAMDQRVDTVAVLGEFDCQFSGLSEFYDGTGLFMAVGDPDLFVARHGSVDLALSDAQQFAGHADKIAAGIASFADGSLVFGGSYEKDLIMPRTQGAPAVWGDFPWAYDQVATPCCSFNADLASYCDDPAYGQFATNFAAGLYDGFLAKSYARGRAPYDMWRREDASVCERVPLEPCLHRKYTTECIDTLWLCNSINGDLLSIIDYSLSPFSWQREDIFHGPSDFETQTGFEVDFLWSTGSTNDYIQVTEEGWVWCQVSTRNGCWTWIDSVYAAEMPFPLPILADQAGVNDGNYPAEDLTCVPPGWIWCTNAPPGAEVLWAANGTTTDNDSLWLDSSAPTYAVFMYSPEGCISVDYFSAIISAEPLVNVTDIQFSYTTDTLTLCAGECGGGMIMLTWFIDGVPADPPASGLVNELTGCTQSLAQADSTLAWEVMATQTGWHPISSTIIYGNWPCDTVGFQLTIIDSVYVFVTPFANGIVTAPALTCPGDTVPVAAICPACDALTWSGAVSVSATGDTAWYTQPGQYAVTLHNTLNGITCSGSVLFLMDGPESPNLYVEPMVVCSDSAALMYTDMPGTDLAWTGPDGPLASQNDSIWTTVTGEYYLSLTDTNGCAVSNGPITLELASTPYMDAWPSVVLCPYDSVVLNVFSNAQDLISWDPPLAGNSPTQVITEGGVYSCSVVSCGITFTMSVEILAGTPDATVPGSPFLFCIGQQIELAGPPGQLIYYWEPVDEYAESIIVDQTGEYQLIVFDEYGCTDTSDVLYVEQWPVEVPLAAQGDTVCAGEDAWLVATGSGSLLWYAATGGAALAVNDSLLVLNATSSATYYVRQEDGFCISDLLAVQLIVIDVPLTLAVNGPSTTCLGDPVEFSTDAPPGTTITWDFPNGSFTGDPLLIASAAFPDSGTYTALASSGSCIGGGASVDLFVLQPMVLDLGVDTTLCAGSSMVLQVPPGFGSVEWSTGASTPAITIISSGTYAVDAIDANGCAVSGSRTVTVEACGSVIPNIVSPNGDGQNDAFVIDGNGGAVELDIYDRWGNHVAQLRGEMVRWNGTNTHNEQVSDGVYFYHALIELFQGSPEERTGYLHVMR